MATPEPKTPACQQAEFASTMPQVDKLIEHPTGWANWRLLLNVIIIGLSVGLFGYDNTFAAPLVALPLFIAKYQGTGIAFTARNLNLIITVPLVGAALGTFVATPLMKYLGRKKTFLVAYFLMCVPGSFLQLFAPDLGALVVGRFWNYVGVSVLTTTAPLYLSELVPSHVRARSVGFCIAGSSATGIIGTTVVWATERLTDTRQYKIPLAIQVALPVAFGLLTLIAVESPHWYVKNDRLEAARHTLMSIRNNKTDLVEAELALIQAALYEDATRQAAVRFWDILKPAHLKRTLTAGALLPLGQVGGQILVLTYSTVLLVQSGVANPFEITIIISCLTFLGTIVGPILVDSVGRRPVAVVGFSILFILDMTAGGLGAAGLTTRSQRLGLAAVFVIFAFFNAVSFQSLSFLLPTEVSTAALREPTVSWAIFWSYTTAIITTFAVPQITSPDAGNLRVKTAFIFGGCVFLTTIWSYFYIPETKARTVAEINEMYDINLPMRKWRKYQCQILNEAAGALPKAKTGHDDSA